MDTRNFLLTVIPMLVAGGVIAVVIVGDHTGSSNVQTAHANNPVIYSGQHLQVVFIQSAEDYKTVDDLIAQGWRINSTDAFSSNYSQVPESPGHYVMMTK